MNNRIFGNPNLPIIAFYKKDFENVWGVNSNGSNYLPLTNKQFQISGGFNKQFGKNNKLGVITALTYNQSFKKTNFANRLYSISNSVASLNFDYMNDKYNMLNNRK